MCSSTLSVYLAVAVRRLFGLRSEWCGNFRWFGRLEFSVFLEIACTSHELRRVALKEFPRLTRLQQLDRPPEGFFAVAPIKSCKLDICSGSRKDKTNLLFACLADYNKFLRNFSGYDG